MPVSIGVANPLRREGLAACVAERLAVPPRQALGRGEWGDVGVKELASQLLEGVGEVPSVGVLLVWLWPARQLVKLVSAPAA